MRVATSIEFLVRGDAATADKVLRAVEGVAKVVTAGTPGDATPATSPQDDLMRIRATFAKRLPDAERGPATEKCVAALVAAGVGVREVRAAGGSLEEVFASLTRDDRTAEAGDA